MLSLLPALCTLVLAAPIPVHEPELPKGPPPRVMTVTTSTHNRQVFHLIKTEYVSGTEEMALPDDNEIKKVEVARKSPVMIEFQVDEKEVQFYGRDGKQLGLKDVRNRLKGPTAVLVSADGKPVDPFYLRLLREDALVVVSKNPHLDMTVPVQAAPRFDRPKLPPVESPEQIKTPPTASPADK